LAWQSLVHNLSEHLAIRRRAVTAGQQETFPWPIGVQYKDLQGFSVNANHNAERDRIAKSIQGEWDWDWEEDAWPTEATYSSPAARNEAYAGWASIPSAYDLVFASNFLTRSETIDEFRDELSDLARSLTPGGLLVALGGTSAKYEKIWSEAESLMRGANVAPVREVDNVLQSHPDPERRQVILRQLIADRNRLRDSGAVLPRWMEELNSREKFPSFRVKAWQRRTGR
jgi:hypothetical protein